MERNNDIVFLYLTKQTEKQIRNLSVIGSNINDFKIVTRKNLENIFMDLLIK